MNMVADHATVSRRITGLYPTLSPQLRRAARYVLDRPDEVALQSMRRLAANAGVNPATMVRLAKALDYPGFEAFREPFRQRLRHPSARYSARARELQARSRSESHDPYGRLLSELLAVDLGNMHETFETIGFDRLGAAAEALGRAHRVYVTGLRSCYPIAFYFHYACRVFRTNIELLDGRGGTFADGLRGLGSDDAVLAISFAPYTRDTVKVVDYANANGATVVAMTDSPVSPLAAAAEHGLIVASASPSVFQSLVSAMAVAQALVATMLVRDGDAALAAIGESERQLRDFQAYWDDNMASPPLAGGREP